MCRWANGLLLRCREATASASSEVRNIAYWAAKNDVERILAEVPIFAAS
jgi:hypothetical protein